MGKNDFQSDIPAFPFPYKKKNPRSVRGQTFVIEQTVDHRMKKIHRMEKDRGIDYCKLAPSCSLFQSCGLFSIMQVWETYFMITWVYWDPHIPTRRWLFFYKKVIWDIGPAKFLSPKMAADQNLPELVARSTAIRSKVTTNISIKSSWLDLKVEGNCQNGHIYGHFQIIRVSINPILIKCSLEHGMVDCMT